MMVKTKRAEWREYSTNSEKHKRSLGGIAVYKCGLYE